MALNYYAMVKDAREAIYEGKELSEFYFPGDYGCSKWKTAKAVWHKANKSVEDQEIWRGILIKEIKSQFETLANVMDDYYNEGFGYSDISDALGISKEAVAEVIKKMEEMG